MQACDLPVSRAVFEFVNQFESYIPNLKREIKFSYGANLRKLFVEMMKDISKANESRDLQERMRNIEDSISVLDSIKLIKRIFTEKKYISLKQSSILDVYMVDVFKQLYGWKSSILKALQEINKNSVR